MTPHFLWVLTLYVCCEICPPKQPGETTYRVQSWESNSSQPSLALIGQDTGPAPPPIGQAGSAGPIHRRGWRIPPADWPNGGHVIPRARKAGERG